MACGDSQPSHFDAQELQQTRSSLQARVDDGQAPGLLTFACRQGRREQADAYGVADLETRLPFRPDTIFPLFSLTKSVVSIAFATLLDEERVQLDAPVSDFIPAFKETRVFSKRGVARQKQQMTLLHLLTHTSGIGYGGDEGRSAHMHAQLSWRAQLGRTAPHNPAAVLSLAQWCRELARIPLEFHPGDDFLYGYNHDVLGRVLEVATKTSLPELLRLRIFAPLGMGDTGFSVPRSKWNRMAAVYERSGSGLRRRYKGEWAVGNSSPVDAGGGGVEGYIGGLVSTLSDYSRVCLMILSKGVFEGRRIIQARTMELCSSNLIPRATGRDDLWSDGGFGVGFGPFGYVATERVGPASGYRPGDFGPLSLSGSCWSINTRKETLAICISLVLDVMKFQEIFCAGVRDAADKFDRSAAVVEIEEPIEQHVPDTLRRERAARLVQKHARRFLNFKARLHKICGETRGSTQSGRSLLHAAASCGQAGLALYLCGKGTDLNTPNLEGDRPLGLAARQGRVEVLKCLLEFRADLAVRNSNGGSALHHAVDQGHLSVVQHLCTARADVDQTSNNGATALRYTAFLGHAAIANYLCSVGADMSIGSPYDGVDATPFAIAATKGHAAVAQVLCDARAELERTDTSGATALVRAAFAGHVAVAQCLCAARALVDKQDDITRSTPLTWAAEQGHASVTRYLCMARADLERRNGFGRTAFWAAARQQHAEVLQVLRTSRTR